MMQIVVLGMHRSGTSVVTRLINLMGAYFGPESVGTGANPENPKGFWERRDVRAANDALLWSTGADWWKVSDFSVDRIPQTACQQFDTDVSRVFEDLDSHRPWLLKEPRLCLLFRMWQRHTDSPVCVIVHRPPLQVAHSLRQRNGFPLLFGIALWERYMLDALQSTAEHPRIFVSFEKIMSDPLGQVENLLGRLDGAGVHGLTRPPGRDVESFVSTDLFHHRQSNEEQRGLLNTPQRKLADALSNGDTSRLDDEFGLSAQAKATLRRFEEICRPPGPDESGHDRHQRRADGTADSEVGPEPPMDDLATLRERAMFHMKTANGLRKELKEAKAGRDDLAARVEAVQTRFADLVEQPLLFLRSAQNTMSDLSNSSRWCLGPLTILPTTRHQSLVKRADDLFRRVAGWTREHRSELMGMIDKSSDSSTAEPVLSSNTVETGPPQAPTAIRHHPRETPRSKPLGSFKLTVAIIAWDVGHNPLGRAYMLASALERHFRVILLGPSFSKYGTQVWGPLRHADLTTISVPGTRFPPFADTLERLAPRIAADVIIACKPRLPSVQLGLLMKSFINRPLIIDIDDFELSFFDTRSPLSLDELSASADAEDLRTPYGENWTRFTESLVPLADAVTVSNDVLREKFGGTLVPHARDEKRFDPRLFDRAAERRRLGIGEDQRVIFFVGTPRNHKGVLEVLSSLREIDNPDYRMVVVGTPPDSRFERALRSEGGSALTLLPSQSFEKLPATVIGADLVCVLQDPKSAISKTQLPAKIVDALALGVPILASRVPPLDPLIQAGAAEAVEPKDLTSAIDRALETSHQRRRVQLENRDLFLSTYSYSAICRTLVPLITESLRRPKKLPIDALGFTRMQRPRQSPSRPEKRTPHVDIDGALDVVLFWKQNDTGLYGRRHDMLIKYLEQSDNGRRIAVFDHPISFELLQERARSESSSQWRDVYRETMARRWGLRDSAKVSYDCFVYSSTKNIHKLQRWRWHRAKEYRWFLERRLSELDIDPSAAVFWFYPRNFQIPEIRSWFSPRATVVDVVDDHRTWPDLSEDQRNRLTSSYRDALAVADLALANCQPVKRSMREFHDDIKLVPNGCEIETPPDLSSDSRFAAFRAIEGPKIGYVGNLEDKIDVKLLEYLASQRPGWQIVLIGSTHMNPEIMKLDDFPNVRFQGIVTYPAVRAWIQELDVAIVPHRDTAQTRSMNPLKVLVYCSVGVPVVSTKIRNLGDFERFVYVADTQEDFLAKVDHAVGTGQLRNHDVLDACLEENSWESRVDNILSCLQRILDRPSR
jgi:glycosyltransferase involved in cell wall biosynthesis